MESLCLGVARENITPEIGGQLYGYRPDVFSESVEDDLTVTAFYFKQGNTQALMLSVTVCLIQTELSQSILSLIEQKFKIPKENCMLCATHTHSGPNVAGQTGWGDIDKKYCDEIFVPAILSTVEKAVNNIQPVKMGTANGNSLVGINRRELNDQNKIILGQNPWGCFDPRMTVISFINESGENVANMIHYGAHGTAAGTNHEISRDWSGIMTDLRKNKKYMMEQLEGFCKFIPSNDIEGDCATTLALQFESEEDARSFAGFEGIKGTLPIDTGKHIYKHWTPVMQKRGALNPLMDPFKMEANKDIVPDYREDMCPKTLDRLSKVVYVSINPDDTKEMLDEKLALIKRALKQN